MRTTTTATCGLMDGLPSGVVVTHETVSARGDGADGDADVVVLVVSEATFEREETVETMATMCARAEGDGTDVVVVCEGERTSEMEATSSRVGIPLAEALDTTRLLDGLENDSTAEAAASLAWADASMREREWVSAFAKRVRDIIVKRAENIIQKYQPARDVVVFWDAVSGDVREAESTTTTSSSPLVQHAANHMLGKIINGAVSGMPSFAVSSAAELAERHLESNPELEASSLQTLIYADATKSFAAGTVLSLGGPLAAPLTMLPALVMYFTIRMRLCVAIAAMGARHDAAATLRPSTVATALLCFFGSNAVDIMAARPTVEQFELDDLMRDLETEDAFRAADVDARGDGDGDADAPRKRLGDVLNEKLRRLGVEAKERTNDAIRAVLESGSRAVREAQKDAARASERAREFVRRHGGSPGEANRAAESAFERRLPISLYERMSAGVFTSENTPILVAELVPAISSYLTIRAATTAMTLSLIHI